MRLDRTGDAMAATSRGRAVTLTVVTVVVLLVVVVAGVVLTRGEEPRSSGGAEKRSKDVAGGTAADAGSAAADAVAQVLDRRAQAVLEQNRAAFLADVDRADAEFVAAQEQLFANLEQVDFASWEYEVLGDDFNRPDLAATYDRPYYVSAVVLHYQLEGFDRAPVARPQALTFVREGTRWLIASDSDADQQLPETGHADPWDRRAIVVGRGKHSLVLADAEDKGRLRELVHASDEAVRRVASFWSDGWRRKVVVSAVRDPHAIETYFRSPGDSSANVAAIAVPAYDTVPGWSKDGGTDEPVAARSRVILNPRYFDAGNRDNLDLLAHEVTHVATQQRTLAGAPRWLVEGAAEYTAYRYLEPFSVRLPPALRRQVAAGSVDLPTYDFYDRDVAAHYVTGFLACAYIADEYGEAALRRVYRLLGRNVRESMTSQEQKRVFRSVLGTTTAQLQEDVAAYARQVSR